MQKIDRKILNLVSQESIKASQSLVNFLDTKGYQIANLNQTSLEYLAKLYSIKKSFVLQESQLVDSDYEFIHKCEKYISRLNKSLQLARNKRKRNATRIILQAFNSMINKALEHFGILEIDAKVYENQLRYLNNSIKISNQEDLSTEVLKKAVQIELADKNLLDLDTETRKVLRDFKKAHIEQL